MSLPCMILAAGFGTRMGALTADRPKPLIPVAGRALIDHALAQADGAGATPLVVNGHYHADQMAAHLAGHHATFLEERPDILDSGGGVKNALAVLGTGPVFTLNADAVWRGPNALRTLLAGWEPTRMGALLLMVPQARATGRHGGGDFAMDAGGGLRRDKGGAVYTGAQIIDARIIADWPGRVFSLRDIWQGLIDQGRLYGVDYPGHWADVGHPAGIALAEMMLEAHDV